ncbi:MAG TPA: hypothetical protein VF657_10565 [Actinoplanes sp.]|jgi:hypothetical protein
MHATQPQGGACPEPPTTPDESAGHFNRLLDDPERFRAWIAQAPATAAQQLIVPCDTDVDGYVITESGLQALVETDPGEAPGTAARVLRSAALYLERHGWIQGAYYDATAQTFTPAACMVGAIAMVCYGGPVDAPAQHFDDPGYLDFEEAVLHLDRYLLAEDGSESYEFNDARGRTLDDVTHVLRDAAVRPADELVDAIRAIDGRNADMAAMAQLLQPCGIWGEQQASASSDGGGLR